MTLSSLPARKSASLPVECTEARQAYTSLQGLNCTRLNTASLILFDLFIFRRHHRHLPLFSRHTTHDNSITTSPQSSFRITSSQWLTPCHVSSPCLIELHHPRLVLEREWRQRVAGDVAFSLPCKNLNPQVWQHCQFHHEAQNPPLLAL